MRVTVEDASIDVVTEGKGDAIVLLHGFPLTREIWNECSVKLAAHTCVVRPDLRGMGRSSVPGGPYLMETLAGDIAAMLDALAIERAVIVGHSLGGYAALAFARMFAERVSRLVLVCSRLAADSPRQAAEREELADRLERDERIEALVDAYVPRLFGVSTQRRHPELIDRVAEAARAVSPAAAAAMLRGMAQRVDSFDIAEDLRMPVLIVHGAEDSTIPQGEAEKMRDAFPDAALAEIGGSGHLPMLESPQVFYEALLAFLGGVQPAGPNV